VNCYIHVPFCRSKCGYCAFYSETGFDDSLVDVYLKHLREVIRPEKLSTLYVGGGTPTVLNERQLTELITVFRDKFSFTADAEISIEANPETLTAEKVAVIRTFFTRISLGVQSFNSGLRKKIGRKCSDSALKNALSLIKEAGFQHWNCDLIYSLPDESMAEWEYDLHSAAGSGCDHISCYSLTPERSAALGQNFSEDDVRERAMYEAAEKILAGYGIKRYEISNYAVPCSECRHNCNVWRGGLLRGYGPGAADFDGVDRHIEVESLCGWLAGESAETDHIASHKRLGEIFAVNLRTVNGWTPEVWKNVPGADSWEKRCEIAQKTADKYPGCLQISPDGIKLSPEGLMFWNDIAADFLDQ
jgi:oxygen-independent coproporphyrinogen-3 oxidase